MMVFEVEAGATTAMPMTVPAAHVTARECKVWNRELEFARAVEQRDARVFAEHVSQGAVLGAGTVEPTRGRAAIVADRKDIIAGTDIALR